jgi:hypothetical protein
MHLEPPEYLEFLQPYPQNTVKLARGLRQAILDILPPCVEIIWDATNTVGPSYGFTDKNRDHFIHLPTYTNYVNIGFTKGTSLNDPEGRLVGAGAKIRHIKLNQIDDLNDPYVRKLIDQALMTADRPKVPVSPCIVIRKMEGPKRRPKPGA